MNKLLLRPTFCVLAASFGWLLTVVPSNEAAVIVDTLGGGPRQGNDSYAGSANGNTFLLSQFNNPFGVALDSIGNLYIAESINNGRIRKVTKVGNTADSVTSTFIATLANPSGIAVDAADNLYVITQIDGKLRKYNAAGTLAQTLATVSSPTALALDGSTNVYITQMDGLIRKVTQQGVVTTIASGFSNPRGITVLENGLLAVSDTGNDSIRLINPISNSNALLTGGNGPGFTDGSSITAQFNQPYGLAKSPSGRLVVADRGNHRVRIVETNGTVSTLYGIAPSQWSVNYPGWEDGDATVAAARHPVAVTVSPSGVVYATEVHYHLLRQATGGPLGASGTTDGGSGGNTNQVVIPPPGFTPNVGYFPMGQRITVFSANQVFYTTDGSEPTPNSRQVALSGNVGTILFQEPNRDLTSLRLKAFSGTNASITVGGEASTVNEVGFSRDVHAGIGSTIIVPVVANLRTNDQLRSIQFRVEITPLDGAPPILPQFRALSILSNDFVQVASSSLPGSVATYTAAPYSIGPTRGLVVSAIGTNANFSVTRFGTVAMLAIPIDVSAVEGHRYRMEVLFPSGSSDGGQTTVPLTAIASRSLLITNISYTVGDSAPAHWYNAGEFGNGDLSNNDVNNAFYAAGGVRIPFTFTDLFDAMDAFPPDAPGSTGGDGEIRFLDWQVLLQRSLRLDLSNFRRAWATGGIRVSQPTALASGSGNRTKNSVAPTASGAVWVRQALVSSATISNAIPGLFYVMPVNVKVGASYSLSGMSFRAVLSSDPDAPPVQGIEFHSARGIPAAMTANSSLNEVLCGWPLSSFTPALQGSILLGDIGFWVPADATLGTCYTLHFYNTDGAPDIHTQYNLESTPACLWVRSPAQKPPEITSDQWKTNFFQTTSNPMAASDSDPDEDGVPNWKEFLAGTNPTDRFSRLELKQTRSQIAGDARVVSLRWLSAPGKLYTIEYSTTVNGGGWTVVASGLGGDGNVREFLRTPVNATEYYRIRLQP